MSKVGGGGEGRGGEGKGWEEREVLVRLWAEMVWETTYACGVDRPSELVSGQ